MKRHHIIIITIIFLSIMVPALLIYQIIQYQNSQLKSINTIMLQEAKSHFQNAVMTRKWNAQYGGVYVKKSAHIRPNPYLEDNHIYSDKGEMLIKINPAWMTRQISEISNKYRDYYFKITSLNPINPQNEPDEFEKEGLNYFEKNSDSPYFYKLDEQTNYFNFLGALKVEQSCLACHARQNYKVGDIRGGIRVSVPVISHNARINEIKSNSVISIAIIIVFTLVINILLIHSILIIVRQNRKYQKLNLTLEERVNQEVYKNQQKEKMLSQQSKLAALGEMLNNIAHQWRQPLSTITTATSGMQIEHEMKVLSNEEFVKSTQLILDQANYMSKTIDDFKNFFQSDKEKTRFVLKDLIIRDIELVKSSYSGQNITVQIDNINDHLSLYGFQNELSQAILNILNNAKDQFTKLSDINKTINIYTKLKESSVELYIHDNAGGVPEDIIDKIFEPYFTTKHQSQGTGIGLYMTQRIIVDHLNGSITVENRPFKLNSEVYEGACFKIELPLVSEID